MSIRRDPRSPFWQYNFQIRNHRFFGSTKKTTRREAEKVEAAERERAKQHVAQIESAKTSLRLDDVAGRYWTEHAQHLAGAPNTWTLLGIVLEFLGKDKLMTEITDDDVARFVAKRRGYRSKSGTLISPYTVNHSVATLRKLFTRCKLWGVRFNHEPKWSKHFLKVPSERVRELSDDEADKIDAVMRDDYAPFFDFKRTTGWRLNECFLRWTEVNWTTREIVKLGKGGKRIHDYRHDFATKLLRKTGNVRLVQKALGHASIKTTERYAHVLESEVSEAIEAVAKRKRPRSRLRDVS